MLAKTDLFPDALASLAEQAKALAHPARLDILRVLASRTTCVCGEIVDELPLAQATVSRHLKVLKEAGLIQGEVDGPRVCYCLDRAALAALRDSLGGFFDALALDAPASSC
jgi:ArsR family transcriptional regulator